LKIIQGNFNKDKSKSLNEKIIDGITKLEDSSDEETLRYPFILIVDTGEDLKVVSDIEMEKFNLLLDLVKMTILSGDYE
jgi:hypothetical protein